MNISSLVIGLSILGAIILPFLIYRINSKKALTQRIKKFEETGYKYSLNLENIVCFKNKIIGFDSSKNKLLFHVDFNSDFNEQLIDLTHQTKVELVKNNAITTDKDSMIDELSLKFYDVNNTIHYVTFFESEVDMNLENELEIINQWFQISNSIIKKNDKKNKTSLKAY